MEAFRRNYGPTADTTSEQAARRNVRVKCSPSQAGRPAGLLDAVCDLWGVVAFVFHVAFPMAQAHRLRFMGQPIRL